MGTHVTTRTCRHCSACAFSSLTDLRESVDKGTRFYVLSIFIDRSDIKSPVVKTPALDDGNKDGVMRLIPKI